MMCEVKLQEGERLDDFTLDGFNQEAFLRLNHEEGGIIVWLRQNAGFNAEVCVSFSDSEHVWTRIEAGSTRLALCHVYLRTNKGKDHIHFVTNQALLDTMREETEWFQSKGYGVVLVGDFNAHTGNESVLGFKSHTHELNNNGALLIDFCKDLELVCLNSMRWGDQDPEEPTFRRNFGHGPVKSILDYALVSNSFLPNVKNFQIHSDHGCELDSDHASLVLEITTGHSTEIPREQNKNQLRKIKKWKKYQNLIERRIEGHEGFSSLDTNHQEQWLKSTMRMVGLSLTTPILKANRRPSKVSPALQRLNLEVKQARRQYFSSMTHRPEQNNVQYRQVWQNLKRKYEANHFMDQVRRKRRTRALMRANGRKSQKLFWSLVSGSKKRKHRIDVLDADGKLVFTTDEKNVLVEQFFIKKFNASYNPSVIQTQHQIANDVNSDLDRLGIPDRKLLPEDAALIDAEFSIDELNANISELDITKAEGEDGITNAMIKNLPTVAKEKLLEIFNNALLSGSVPDDWRVGEVVLVLKKNPPTIIDNYRPITLISCISKLMTKMLAKRISAAVESSNILGPEQQGFRKGKCCEDNIFIINSLLAKAASKKAVTHLMFLDLKEAYDRVDRPTLYKKLKQLNFPSSFISFLEDYYSNDTISSSSVGGPSRKIYLSRGLRQGCNLSSILFIIYISELGNRLRRANVGLQVTQSILLSFLKFADDILLFTGLWSEMMTLVKILEKWCQDFKMIVSVTKTKVVTPSTNLLWKIINMESGIQDDIEKLQEFKYLGLLQRHGVEATVLRNAANKLEKAKLYQRNILRIKRLIPDKIEVYITIWKNVALPCILYGLEALPYSEVLEDQLEQVQLSLGKSILGLRQSTAGQIVYTELGLKPIRLLITERKVRYYLSVMAHRSRSSKIVQLLMKQQIDDKTSLYYCDLARRVSIADLHPEDLQPSSLNIIRKAIVRDIKLKIASFKSLEALPIPSKWWTRQIFVKEEAWSQALSEFRGGNAKLGNRDTSLSDFAVSNPQGRVITCPLCLKGPNNETHILVDCPKLVTTRNSLLLTGETTLQAWIDDLKAVNNSSLVISKLFLGQERSIQFDDYVKRGYILLELRDSFMRQIYARFD